MERANYCLLVQIYNTSVTKVFTPLPFTDCRHVILNVPLVLRNCSKDYLFSKFFYLLETLSTKFPLLKLTSAFY